jgi:hypothetical protein
LSRRAGRAAKPEDKPAGSAGTGEQGVSAMSKFFINRPIVAMVISILMTIVGLVAMSGLPTAQFPNIVPPQIRSAAPTPAPTR